MENASSPSFLGNIKERVQRWRNDGYTCEFPAIAEILSYSLEENGEGEKALKYLRRAQFEALETYWYLRLIENTPHVMELYRKVLSNTTDFLRALGIPIEQPEILELLLSSHGVEALLDRIQKDELFVKKHKLETLRESASLRYPSYILALAMGSGKTFLIGAIIATEFAMALEYPYSNFVRNALVFAPGKTILGALKEISDTPFDKILPPRFYNPFVSTVKMTYTQDKEKDIPVISGSTYNLIVTNTEKIRIQKSVGKKRIPLFNFKQKERQEEEEETVNLRLQKIASLSSLAIFSDEAHHTYGNSLNQGLKKVRRTVDYIAQHTNVIVVVNTTGTPYYRRQMLKDVVYWYSMSDGIHDGILKEVSGNIVAYSDIESSDFVKLVIRDFHQSYWKTSLYNESKAKLAIYFPQTRDLEKMKVVVEEELLDLGLDPTLVLEVHNKSSDDVKDLFNNGTKNPSIPYRVFLLVNMGTEGWDCPSLFATALARKLKSSNNFVLQAASRCLRQVPGNSLKAKIYLSEDNRRILDSQLKETYGESIAVLSMVVGKTKKEKIMLRKTDIAPVRITKKLKRVVFKKSANNRISLSIPNTENNLIGKTTYAIGGKNPSRDILVETGRELVGLANESTNAYDVAIEISAIYRMAPLEILKQLNSLYSGGDVPVSHIMELKKQIEAQIGNYVIIEENTQEDLRVIKPEGFLKESVHGREVYTAEIACSKEREHLLCRIEDFGKPKFGFHYTPYNFDSYPELDFFNKLLYSLQIDPDDIDDMFFIGAINDPKKTDFIFEYKDKEGKSRSYSPDFLIRKNNGEVLIVEIKGSVFRDKNKEKALESIEKMNSGRLTYRLLQVDGGKEDLADISLAKDWIYDER